MKLYIADLNQLLNYIKNDNVKGLLLYGPDKGYINFICNIIKKKLDFLKVNISYSGLKAESLSVQLNAKNFFSQRELIVIQNVSGSFDQKLKSVIVKDIVNFPIFIGDEIASSSAIRKFFEHENYLAAIGCYYDEKNTNKLIAEHLKNFLIDQATMEYLKINLTGDYQYVLNELEKLSLYIEASSLKQLTLAEVSAVINPNTLSGSDEMCAFFAAKKLDQFLAVSKKFMEQTGFNEVMVIRSLLRFYVNIYTVNSKLKQGEQLDNAIKTILPPIFFKNINSFKQAALSTSIAETLRIIAILQKAEKNLKSSTGIFDIFSQIYLPAHLI